VGQKWARPWYATTFALVVVELVITLAAGATWVDRRLPPEGLPER
jgi:hypothetical protein